MFNPVTLWAAPVVNPVNHKARSIPGLNPINVYGRVFFFSWFGFLIAFWSWYAFPPLINVTIAKDLKLSKAEISNSNIIALVATLLVRLVAGPSCDRFGPRKTFAGILLIGAIPTFLSGTAYTASELYALRFFIGILGGSFVPCQVWMTGFFDKSVVGTANAFAAGLGNSGGGITYFLMPAIYDSLVHDRHLTPHVAWRVAFVVPGICIVSVALALLFLCPDTPTGKWEDRHLAVKQNLAEHGVDATVVDAPSGVMEKKSTSGSTSPDADEKRKFDATGERRKSYDNEAVLPEQEMLDVARGEVVQKPSFKEAIPVIFSLHTLVPAAAYFCTFGSELSVNSILGAYYLENFKKLGQTGSGNWAAMFGMLNACFRPIGGLVSDYIYRRTGNLWLRKAWLHGLSIMTGVFLIIIGVLNPHEKSKMFGLIAGLAFWLEAANGANYSLVPHIYPHANGIISGCVGASGNLGGIIFAIIFREEGKDYAKVFYIIGSIVIGVNLAVSWIPPISRKQIGGR